MPRKKDNKLIIDYDIFGYANALKYKPKYNYDLVMVQDDKGKEQVGWWDGFMWDMWPRKIGKKIIKWRPLRASERVEND